MTGDQDTIHTQILPSSGEIGQWNGPVGLFLVDMRLVNEAIWTVWSLRKESFVILSLKFESNLGIETKEGRQEMG